ncbi:MAG TPA: metallophosphoesterase [Gemmatimonadaceae bacterium]|nr:metallophosphoesterase [Gemmatimonadaceae bacterium]
MIGNAGSRLVHAARWSPTELATRELVIGDLAQEFDGYTVVALSDLHHPPTLDARWIGGLIDTVNATSPDLVALLGDYGTSFKHLPATSRAWYRTAMRAMASECARLDARDGVMAVLGNHDYYAGAEEVRAWLHGFGAEVLVNRARVIQRGSACFRVAGMDDIVEGTVDPRVGCEPGPIHPTLVLSHNPDTVLHLAPDVRVDAMLAGHTHGGQLVLPWYGAPLRMARVCGRRSASGWVAHDRAAMYVMRGVGAQLPIPVRVNCPPEILVLRLRSGHPTSGHQQPA